MSDFSQLIENIDPSQFDELFMPANKRQRYGGFRRSQAARRIQSSYRRYRGAGSSDQRQLRSVVRSHRKANPYQITPSSGRTVTFWRKCEINIPLNQSTGWVNGGVGLGLNLNWGFALGKIYGFVNGAYVFSPDVPSATEFQALFDYYKIHAVKMQMFFIKNTSDQAGGSTIGMPIMLIANDFDDVGETMTLALMNQRVGCRHVQFSSDNLNGINHYIKPKPTSVLVQSDVSTGIQTSSNSGVVFGTQWIDSAVSNILHNGIKIWYDNQGLTSATLLGNVTFVFDVCYVMKGYR